MPQSSALLPLPDPNGGGTSSLSSSSAVAASVSGVGAGAGALGLPRSFRAGAGAGAAGPTALPVPSGSVRASADVRRALFSYRSAAALLLQQQQQQQPQLQLQGGGEGGAAAGGDDVASSLASSGLVEPATGTIVIRGVPVVSGGAGAGAAGGAGGAGEAGGLSGSVSMIAPSSVRRSGGTEALAGLGPGSLRVSSSMLLVPPSPLAKRGPPGAAAASPSPLSQSPMRPGARPVPLAAAVAAAAAGAGASPLRLHSKWRAMYPTHGASSLAQAGRVPLLAGGGGGASDDVAGLGDVAVSSAVPSSAGMAALDVSVLSLAPSSFPAHPGSLLLGASNGAAATAVAAAAGGAAAMAPRRAGEPLRVDDIAFDSDDENDDVDSARAPAGEAGSSPRGNKAPPGGAAGKEHSVSYGARPEASGTGRAGLPSSSSSSSSSSYSSSSSSAAASALATSSASVTSSSVTSSSVLSKQAEEAALAKTISAWPYADMHSSLITSPSAHALSSGGTVAAGVVSVAAGLERSDSLLASGAYAQFAGGGGGGGGGGGLILASGRRGSINSPGNALGRSGSASGGGDPYGLSDDVVDSFLEDGRLRSDAGAGGRARAHSRIPADDESTSGAVLYDPTHGDDAYAYAVPYQEPGLDPAQRNRNRLKTGYSDKRLLWWFAVSLVPFLAFAAIQQATDRSLSPTFTRCLPEERGAGSALLHAHRDALLADVLFQGFFALAALAALGLIWRVWSDFSMRSELVVICVTDLALGLLRLGYYLRSKDLESLTATHAFRALAMCRTVIFFTASLAWPLDVSTRTRDLAREHLTAALGPALPAQVTLDAVLGQIETFNLFYAFLSDCDGAELLDFYVRVELYRVCDQDGDAAGGGLDGDEDEDEDDFDDIDAAIDGMGAGAGDAYLVDDEDKALLGLGNSATGGAISRAAAIPPQIAMAVGPGGDPRSRGSTSSTAHGGGIAIAAGGWSIDGRRGHGSSVGVDGKRPVGRSMGLFSLGHAAGDSFGNGPVASFLDRDRAAAANSAADSAAGVGTRVGNTDDVIGMGGGEAGGVHPQMSLPDSLGAPGDVAVLAVEDVGPTGEVVSSYQHGQPRGGAGPRTHGLGHASPLGAGESTGAGGVRTGFRRRRVTGLQHPRFLAALEIYELFFVPSQASGAASGAGMAGVDASTSDLSASKASGVSAALHAHRSRLAEAAAESSRRGPRGPRKVLECLPSYLANDIIETIAAYQQLHNGLLAAAAGPGAVMPTQGATPGTSFPDPPSSIGLGPADARRGPSAAALLRGAAPPGLLAAASRPLPRALFDEAQSLVLQAMRDAYWPSFAVSAELSAALEQANEHARISSALYSSRMIDTLAHGE